MSSLGATGAGLGRKSRRAPRLLIAGTVAYTALGLGLGRFMTFDEVYFKSPGRNWAAEGRFAAPEVWNFWHLHDPPVQDIWFTYPPLYPFLFGLWVKAVGFGWRSCVGFDLVIQDLLALATWLLARRGLADRNGRSPGAELLGLATLPVSFAGVGRPDVLATALGTAALALVRGREGPGGTVLGAGALLGLCAGASPGAGGLLGLLVVAQIVTARPGWARGLVAVGTLGAASLAVFSLVLAPILVPRPDALTQFLELSRRVAHLEGDHLQFALRWGKWEMAALACLLAGGHWAWWRAGAGRRAWLRDWSMVLCGAVLVLGWVPKEHYYIRFLMPWALVQNGWALARDRGTTTRADRAVIGSALAAGILLGARPWLVSLLLMASLPAQQRPEPMARRLRERVPSGSVVVAHEHWWFLADRCRVYDPTGAELEDSGEIDYIIFSGNGIGGLAPPRPSAVLKPPLSDVAETEFIPIENTLNHTPLTVFGARLTRSAYGFGYLLLGRSGHRPGTTGPGPIP